MIPFNVHDQASIVPPHLPVGTLNFTIAKYHTSEKFKFQLIVKISQKPSVHVPKTYPFALEYMHQFVALTEISIRISACWTL